MWRRALPRPEAKITWEIVIWAALLSCCGRVTRDVVQGDDASIDEQPQDAAPPAARNGALGAGCEPLSELDPEFSGFSINEISIDERTPACLSGTCVIQGFQGRVSCPYGQATASGGCTIPGSNEPVLTPVAPQLLARPAGLSAVCSCHCAGPGPGPYCACPTHMECSHLVDDLGFGARDIAGSYCLPEGARYERGSVDISASCRSDLQNCEF